MNLCEGKFPFTKEGRVYFTPRFYFVLHLLNTIKYLI